MTRDYLLVPGTEHTGTPSGGAWSLKLDREGGWWDAS